jgi:DNA-binding winged helix-turn-helix (wHTH) protein
MPRLVRAGPITLDLFHRDGLVGDKWAGFHPREFEVLWRLAETPRIVVTRTELLKDVWRLEHFPETNRVEVHISRIRSKLHVFKLSWLVVTNPTGGYCLEADVEADGQPDPPASQQGVDDMQALDSYLRAGNDSNTSNPTGEAHAISGKRPSID